ncbi:MAG: polysaccharide deacetylase family protein [Chloroflexi bacterium]|nr:polysaccharide deacetylase family protein [Chloroflexota bacterium]
MVNPLVTKLGYGPADRLVIFHADDVGMCHGSNQAFLDLHAAGMLKTGSVMVPCPWMPEILQKCQADPALDLGVHLTLTSEWSNYRWGPVSTRAQESGLLDPAGYFWSSPKQVQDHINVEAAVAEMRAQIEQVRAAGIDFTHLDTHMGVAGMRELIHHYIELALAYRVPLLVYRQMDEPMRQMGLQRVDDPYWSAFITALEAKGMGLVDWFRITPGYDGTSGQGDRAVLYENILHNLQPGITYFSLHPNAPGDIETIDPINAHWRTLEYEYFQSQRLRDFLAAERITPIGFRAIRDVMRSQ